MSRHKKSSVRKAPGAKVVPKALETGGSYFVEYGLFRLNPGSPVAQAQGCTCAQHDGTEMFSCRQDCSIHGLAQLIAALEEAGNKVKVLEFNIE
jgi:hypothetical protein